jgi:beta-lactamase regulating signal transducer with metallopeptidase domain
MTTFTAAVDLWSPLMLALTWQLAALALIGWLCQCGFQLRQPRVRHALWWCVLTAPMLLAPGRILLQRRQAVVAVRAPAVMARVSALGLAPGPLSARTPVRVASQSTPAGAREPRVLRPRLADLLGLAWLLGCAALALRLTVGHRRVRRLLSASTPIETDDAREMLSSLCEQARVGGEVELRASSAIGSPVLYGRRRPVIVVPQGWLGSLTADELRAMLAHEVAHVRRQDFLANLLQRLIEIPLFFHPGAWLGSRRIALAREELCDAWALSLGTDAASYARSLAAAAERTQSAFAPVSLGIAESRFTLLRRVEAIMQSREVGRLRRPWAAALMVVLVGAVATLLGVQVRAEPGRSALTLARSAAAQVASVAEAYVAPAEALAPAKASLPRVLKWPYNTPFQHNVRLVFDSYVKGERTKDYRASGMLLPAGPGKHTVTIKVDDTGDQIRLAADLDGVPAGTWSRPVHGQRTISEDLLPPDVSAGTRLPIYVFKLCSDDPEGKRSKLVPRYESSAAEVAKATDLTVLVMAEIRRDDSTPPPPSPPAQPVTATQATGIVFETIELKYWPAGYLLHLFGAADLPDSTRPIAGLSPLGWQSGAASESASEKKAGLAGMAAKEPGGMSGGGSLSQFLPDGIKVLATASPVSQQLLVGGTREAIAQLRSLIGQLDRKPQQVILTVMVYEGAPENATSFSAVGGDMSIVYPREGETHLRFAGRVVDAMRVATMNMVPAYSVARAIGTDQSQQTLITALPQILGDGTMNLVVQLAVVGKSDAPTFVIPSAFNLLATINVRDGEPFGIVLTRGDSTITLVITPQIVHD